MAINIKIQCQQSLSIEDILRLVVYKSGNIYAIKVVKV